MIELILTFFYTGKIKKAPGTFGSITALLFWFLLTELFVAEEISISNQNIFWGIFLVSILFFGIFTIRSYSQKFRTIDHGSIVLDEVLGQILALQMTFNFIRQDYFFNNFLILQHLLFCFILFRFLDIKKPLFIGWCDKNLKNSFGVMFDDLLCGLIVGGVGILLSQIRH